MNAHAGKARSVIVLAFASFLVAAGCSTARTGAVPSSTARTLPTAPAAVHAQSVDNCLPVSPRQVEQVADPGGGTLTLAVLGTGPRVVILSEQSDELLCSWVPFARRLAAAGYRVVLWDFGGGLPADELTAVVRHVASKEATRIVLMGASEGAKASLVTAARLGSAVSGAVSLSAETVLNPGIQVADSVRRLHCPLLLVTASQDAYDSASAARQFMALAPSAAKRLVTVPGSDHGTALLSGRSGATTVPAVIDFLRLVPG